MSSTAVSLPVRAGPQLKGEVKHDSGISVEFPPQSELFVLWAIGNGRPPGVYGLDIKRAIEECGDGNVKFSTGTLYSMLKRLRKKGYITSVEGSAPAGGGNRQYYSLTESGQAVVDFAANFLVKLRDWQP